MRRVLSALAVGAFGALPLALPVFVSSRAFPPLLAYLVADGRDLVWASALLAALGVLLAQVGSPAAFEQTRARLSHLSESRLFWTAFGFGLLSAFASIPEWRSNASVFGGDEPKYLRMAQSLARDLDVDVASASQLPPSLSRTGTNARRLLRSAGDALAGLFTRPATAADHRWNLGNWTVAGAHGGHYYVQSPGLPILLLPATLAQAILLPDRTGVFLSLATLAALLAFGFAETLLLTSALAGRPGGMLVTAAAFVCAPLLIGCFHFYPESAAVALVPWLLRHGLSDRPVSGPRCLGLGLGIGFLPWLHPKFLPLAAILAALLSLRLRATRPRIMAAAGALLPLIALLLYDHRVTGLLTPDALYRRFASDIYQGPRSLFSAKLLNGLVTAFFGARDGLFVMAPWLAAGALAFVAALRRDTRRAVALVAVVSSLAIAAAVHEGGAPGPPGRLMAPVAPALAALIALALPVLRHSIGFGLTLALFSWISLSITLGMRDDQRRTVNPYRDVFSDAAQDFSRDLPDGPGRRPGPLALHKARDLGRGALLCGGLLFWAWRFDRAGVRRESAGGAAVLWLLGLWCSVAATAWGLTALGP